MSSTYVVLVNLTQQGIQEFKNLPDRLKALEENIQKSGGKLIGWYLTMGQYDAVAISEFPDDETAARGVIGTAAQGRVRTTTLKAFTRDQAEAIARSLP